VILPVCPTSCQPVNRDAEHDRLLARLPGQRRGRGKPPFVTRLEQPFGATTSVGLARIVVYFLVPTR
jgi:hypothetical protein